MTTLGGLRARGEQSIVVAIAAGALGLVSYLGFNAGGFFPDASAVGIVALLAVIAVVVVSARRPDVALRGRFVFAIGALGLLAVWQLVTAIWSHAPVARSSRHMARCSTWSLWRRAAWWPTARAE